MSQHPSFPLFTKCREVMIPETGEVVRALVPDNALSVETLAKVRLGRTMHTVTETARNYDQLKLLYALADKIHQNSDRFDSKEHVVEELKMNTGHVERKYIRVPGIKAPVFLEWPASISYESMTQAEWSAWLPKALNHVTTEIWPTMPEGVLKDEISAMLGDDSLWPDPAPNPRARKTREVV